MDDSSSEFKKHEQKIEKTNKSNEINPKVKNHVRGWFKIWKTNRHYGWLVIWNIFLCDISELPTLPPFHSIFTLSITNRECICKKIRGFAWLPPENSNQFVDDSDSYRFSRGKKEKKECTMLNFLLCVSVEKKINLLFPSISFSSQTKTHATFPSSCPHSLLPFYMPWKGADCSYMEEG